MDKVKEILEDRGSIYGDYKEVAKTAQELKTAARTAEGWYHNLPGYQKEAIDMILHKIARAIEGNKYFVENWDDIAGYASLVAEEIRKNPNCVETKVLYIHTEKTDA